MTHNMELGKINSHGCDLMNPPATEGQLLRLRSVFWSGLTANGILLQVAAIEGVHSFASVYCRVY